MSHAFAIGWEGGLTMRWGGDDEEPRWSWSYRDDFLPILHAACPPGALARFVGRWLGK